MSIEEKKLMAAYRALDARRQKESLAYIEALAKARQEKPVQILKLVSSN